MWLFQVSIKKLDLLANSMEISPSSEAISCAATQEFPNTL
jgi:hypothetical protein